eukprot:3151832-Heterocapsa_arctica.AAC.1
MTVALDVNVTDNIESVKGKIQELTGYAVERQELIFYDPNAGTFILQEADTLHDYDIKEGSSLH